MPSQSQLIELAPPNLSGGHWGSAGGRAAPKNTWGGVNMVVTRDGGVMPVSSSRPLTFTNLEPGEVKGMFWAYGVDERIYFVQELTGEDAGTFQIRRFLPNADGTVITIEDVGDPVDVCVRLPDWTTFSDSIYVTFFRGKTWTIDPVANTLTKLTGPVGDPEDAPGGRTIATFGERLMIGGVDDVRFSDFHGNRVVYSEAAEPGNMPATNFFDVGADNIELGGMYPMRDHLLFVLEDQTMWSYNGVPGFTDNLRRLTGFPKGSGGIRAFTHDNGAVDPIQTRLWYYDHVTRAPTRWSGAAPTKVPGFGVVSPNRTAVGRVEGAMAMVGGPDEFVMDRVPIARTESEDVDPDLVLVRVNGAVALVERTVLTGRN